MTGIMENTSHSVLHGDSIRRDDSSCAVELEGYDYSPVKYWTKKLVNSMFFRTEMRSAKEVVDRIRDNRYLMEPDYQRDFVWDLKKQSKFIESCILRIPLTLFYVALSPEGKITIVDGLQRLTTLKRYMDGDFKLDMSDPGHGENEHPLEGLSIEQLAIVQRERLEKSPLTLCILEPETPEWVMLDIFERVNSGIALTRQQMRNALYCGPATRWLRSAVEGEPFKIATDNTICKKTMRDREAVNRFVSFKLIGWENYINGDMDDFLKRGLFQLNDISETEREELRKEFDDSMKLNHEIFGRHAFRRTMCSMESYRTVINISLFELFSVAFSTHGRSQIRTRREEIRNAIRKLLQTSKFYESITRSTNSTKAVQNRFRQLEESVQNIVSL